MFKRFKKFGEDVAKQATITTTDTAKKSTEFVGELAGNAVRGTAKGLYKGVTGNTDEDIERKRLLRKTEMEVVRKQRVITNWAWLIFIGVISVMTLLFIGDSGFSSSSLSNVLSERWIVYVIPLVLFVLVNVFSRKIAEETTMAKIREN